MDFEKEVQRYKEKGIPTPSKKMIKTASQIEGIREAGKINTMVLDEVARRISVGMTTEEIDEIVAAKTKELGGIYAPLHYEGFPKGDCTSINDAVCHGIPSKSDVLKEGDIVNVDCTTIYKGYYADASRTFLIGTCDPVAKRLTEVTKEALDQAVSKLKPYSRLRDIGHTIETYVREAGFSVVHEIGGHGVGLEFHEDPFIYHYGKPGSGMVLFPGMVFTIEPMVNEGKRHVYLDASNNWTIYTEDGKRSAQFEYTVLLTETGAEILSY